MKPYSAHLSVPSTLPELSRWLAGELTQIERAFIEAAGAALEYGDADVTVRPGTSVFSANLTANRTVTLPNASRVRVVRSGGDTGGPWTLDVGGLKSLSAGEWCDLEFIGSTWIVTASGAL